MPGWKKNIPACLQPDQEGGKSGPKVRDHSDPPVSACLRECARVRVCWDERVFVNYQR